MIYHVSIYENLLWRNMDMDKAELISLLKKLKKLNENAARCKSRLDEAKKKLVELNSNTTPYQNVTKGKITSGDVIFSILLSLFLGGIAFGITYVIVIVVRLVLCWFGIDGRIVGMPNLIVGAIAGGLIFALILFGEISGKKSDIEKEYNDKLKYNEYVKNLQSNSQSIRFNFSNEFEATKQAFSEVEQLRDRIGIHKDYSRGYQLDDIITLLEHGRADSLKEAVNIHVQEVHQAHREHEEDLARRQQQRILEQQAEELAELRYNAGRAADAAEEANRRQEMKERQEFIDRMLNL